MGAFELVETYGDREYAIVRETKVLGDDMTVPERYLVCGYRLDDDDVRRPDTRYYIADWPTQAEAWAFVCGYEQGVTDNA